MALISTNLIGEVRQTGSDLNGGFFNTARVGGVDYTQSDTPILSVNDLVTNGTNLNITSATGGFTASMVGNTINIAGALYEISVYNNPNSISVPSSSMPPAGTNQSARVGGALATPQFAAANITSAAYVHLKGSWSINPALADNVAGGPINIPITSYWEGYGTTRQDGGRCNFTLTGSADKYFFTVTNSCKVRSMNADGGGYAVSGFSGSQLTTNTEMSNLTAQNFGGRGFRCCNGYNENVLVKNCGNGNDGVVNSGLLGAFIGRGIVERCTSIHNTGIGFDTDTTQTRYFECVAAFNTSAGFSGQRSGNAVDFNTDGCIAAFNSGTGFVATSGSTQNRNHRNDIVYGNTTFGFQNTKTLPQQIFIINCAGGSNPSGNYETSVGSLVQNFTILSSNPFVNSAADDFRLKPAIAKQLIAVGMTISSRWLSQLGGVAAQIGSAFIPLFEIPMQAIKPGQTAYFDFPVQDSAGAAATPDAVSVKFRRNNAQDVAVTPSITTGNGFGLGSVVVPVGYALGDQLSVEVQATVGGVTGAWTPVWRGKVTDVANEVWGATTRTLSGFGFTVNTNANATETAIKAKTDLIGDSVATAADVHVTVNGGYTSGDRTRDDQTNDLVVERLTLPSYPDGPVLVLPAPSTPENVIIYGYTRDFGQASVAGVTVKLKHIGKKIAVGNGFPVEYEVETQSDEDGFWSLECPISSDIKPTTAGATQSLSLGDVTYNIRVPAGGGNAVEMIR